MRLAEVFNRLLPWDTSEYHARRSCLSIQPSSGHLFIREGVQKSNSLANRSNGYVRFLFAPTCRDINCTNYKNNNNGYYTRCTALYRLHYYTSTGVCAHLGWPPTASTRSGQCCRQKRQIQSVSLSIGGKMEIKQ